MPLPVLGKSEVELISKSLNKRLPFATALSLFLSNQFTKSASVATSNATQPTPSYFSNARADEPLRASMKLPSEGLKRRPAHAQRREHTNKTRLSLENTSSSPFPVLQRRIRGRASFVVVVFGQHDVFRSILFSPKTVPVKHTAFTTYTPSRSNTTGAFAYDTLSFSSPFTVTSIFSHDATPAPPSSDCATRTATGVIRLDGGWNVVVGGMRRPAPSPSSSPPNDDGENDGVFDSLCAIVVVVVQGVVVKVALPMTTRSDKARKSVFSSDDDDDFNSGRTKTILSFR